MASSANSNPVPKLYKTVMEDVINEVRELFLDEGVDEQVLMELKTLWESKLMQSKAVDGFHSEEQQVLQAPPTQVQQVQQTQQTTQPQQVLLPPAQQAPQQQVIIQDPKILQHMGATGMSAAATAATLALPTGVTGVGPYQQLITNQGQILQVVRAANGAQYIIQPQQQIMVQQQVLPQLQPGGVQAPVIQQVLTPVQGGLSQQTGVIIQPQQIVLTQNKVQQNTQVMQAALAQGPAQTQPQTHTQTPQQPQTAQQQAQQSQAPLVLQVDGAGDTSSEEDEEEEDEYDEDDDEDKDKDGGEDGQVEEPPVHTRSLSFQEPLNSGDDVSDEEDQELFDTENVVVCQYDKIHRSKNKWKFHLKDGIMNLNGRDYVFSKAIGDAEW
ncbi:hypothetical protein QTP70_027073 [Hemibagrus guttatus]|uniref:Transcription initiation factor IIA subunit 1 n=1 Tax=Hemibagrus guttatus TaxID=175788 RepID=A0AAE0UT96_9TELE|nr:hypothetical protein QTP70_027073 [Hemibagrus guttatus]KAK3542540.1 hypothetical protein QTP86_028672 [Hemibagrus guttatus]